MMMNSMSSKGCRHRQDRADGGEKSPETPRIELRLLWQQNRGLQMQIQCHQLRVLWRRNRGLQIQIQCRQGRALMNKVRTHQMRKVRRVHMRVTALSRQATRQAAAPIKYGEFNNM